MGIRNDVSKATNVSSNNETYLLVQWRGSEFHSKYECNDSSTFQLFNSSIPNPLNPPSIKINFFAISNSSASQPPTRQFLNWSSVVEQKATEAERKKSGNTASSDIQKRPNAATQPEAATANQEAALENISKK